MSIEWLVAIGGFLGVLYGLYERQQAGKKGNRADTIAQLERTALKLEEELTANRLYASGLETKQRALKEVAGRLRDECSLYRTTLRNHGHNIPDSRLAVTKPLHQLVQEVLQEDELESDEQKVP